MLKIFGETYHIDFDKIENLISIKQTDTGDTEQNVSIVKFELIKTMLDVVLSEVGEIDVGGHVLSPNVLINLSPFQPLMQKIGPSGASGTAVVELWQAISIIDA